MFSLASLGNAAVTVDCQLDSEAVFGLPSSCVAVGTCDTSYFDDVFAIFEPGAETACALGSGLGECCLIGTPDCENPIVYPNTTCYALATCPSGTASVVSDLECPNNGVCCTADITTSRGCVQGLGRWRKEENRDASCESLSVCGLDAETIFSASPKHGDVFFLLGRQYLAASCGRTCGCANPDGADIQLIESAGVFLAERCMDRPINGRHPDRRQGIQIMSALDQYNSGNLSVPLCECDENATAASASNAEDQVVLDAMYATASYSYAIYDEIYARDSASDTPINWPSELGWVVAGIVGAAILALVVVGTVKIVRRFRVRGTYRQVRDNQQHEVELVSF